MCTRFSLHHEEKAIRARFGIAAGDPPVKPRFNISPGEQIPVIRAEQGRAAVCAMQWGLVPHWAKEPRISARLFQGDAENLETNRAFQSCVRERRCLIPADGFYLWRRTGYGQSPTYVRRGDYGLFAFAGIWDAWLSPTGGTILSCAIVTVPANRLLSGISARMPAICIPGEEAVWLEQSRDPEARWRQVLAPYPSDLLDAYPVTGRVNHPRFDAPSCIVPLTEAPANSPP